MLHLVRRRGARAIRRLLALALFLLALGLILAPVARAQEGAAWTRQLDSLVAAQMARTHTPGVQVAVAYEGRVVFTKGYGVADIETARPVTTQTLFRVGSVTKMVTGVILAELAEQGTLDLRAPIARYVTELEGRRVGAVTAHQLLTHSAGWLDNAVPFGRMGEGALGEVMVEVTDTLFFTEPDQVISYSNPGYSMAGYVAERAAGRRFGTLADELVLRPMGMPHATFRPLHALTRDFSQGHIGMPNATAVVSRPFTENTAQWAAGFLMASAQDMARFAIALMDGGMLDGTRVLREGTVRRVTQGEATIPGDSAARYGYGLMVGRSGAERVWQHGGSINGFDAMVTMLPDRRLAVIVLDNRSGPGVTGATNIVAQGLAGVVLPERDPPPSPRLPTANERARLVGRYAQGRNTMEVLAQGDSLVFRQGMSSLGVRMVGTDRIALLSPSDATVLSLVLVRDATGRVRYLHQGLRAIARQEAP
jgi:CubicO group peptidase (beta-lactamase class C family)